MISITRFDLPALVICEDKPIASATTMNEAHAYAVLALAQTAKTFGLWTANRIEVLPRLEWIGRRAEEVTP